MIKTNKNRKRSDFKTILFIVKTYNQDKLFLANKAIATVVETEESLNQRRSGNSDIVTLENTSQKNIGLLKKIVITI